MIRYEREIRESFLNAILRTAKETMDGNAVQRVAEALGQDSVQEVISKYSGMSRHRKNVMESLVWRIKNVAYRTRQAEATRSVAEAFCKNEVYEITGRYKGRALDVAMKILGSIALHTREPYFARVAADVIDNYKDDTESVEHFMYDLARTGYMKHDVVFKVIR
ncbi:MAG: hypothetical protein QMD85_02910, partial [Candidatus Aenigmarchaeota archaeon]|nr:hypothetical protein [Candidatus Aenigmarchaeota archaeon]MDI6722498.1 hypothetical protein [Candidatus Aenigmarchaeota archaeon]